MMADASSYRMICHLNPWSCVQLCTQPKDDIMAMLLPGVLKTALQTTQAENSPRTFKILLISMNILIPLRAGLPWYFGLYSMGRQN